jgi:SRSO17 transposase
LRPSSFIMGNTPVEVQFTSAGCLSYPCRTSRRSTGEQKYYVSNLPADATIKTLAATIKARWVCEQAHQQLKEELGLDHFEGRSWTGLHRHGLMTMIAYAFLQSRRLKAAGRKKKNLRTAPTTKHAGHQASDPRPLRTTSAPTMSSL